MKAALPVNESERLAYLHRLDILDTRREQSFDDIAQLAMTLCGVPIAVVSLVDRERQWFKSCLGLDAEETPRDVAFCAHAILTPDDLLIVEDAQLDHRFADNALVVGEPHIRFYAGAPLVTKNGLPLGTLCVIDYVPRQLSEKQRAMLKLLAGQVMQLLQLRETNLALAQERESLDDVLKGANLGTWRWNVQTGETVFNERWAEIVGYTLAELAPVSVKTWLTLTHPDDLTLSSQLLEQHFRGELEFYELQCRMKHKAGHWVNVLARGRVISFTAEGNPLWMSGTHSDITELHNSRRRIQENEERLQTMISNFPGAVYRCENNARWTMLYLSNAVQQLTGYPAEQFIDGAATLSMTDITHPDDVPVLYDLVQEALKNKKPFHTIYRILHADGLWRWVEEVGRGVYGANGEIKYIDGFVWDITVAEEARNVIQLSEQKLSTLYNQAPVAIILNSMEDGRFIECNPEFVRMIGYTQEEILRIRYSDITPQEYTESDQAEVEKLIRHGRFGPYEKQYIHKEGHLIPILTNGVLIENEEGKQQIWSFIQDMTERKRIEQMKNEFVSAVSHELRTPLTAISGSLGLIVNGMLGELPANVKNMLGIAHKNSQRLTLLINDLLDMEKLLAGKMAFDMRVQPLLPIIEASIEGTKAYADTFNVSLVLCDNPVNVLVNIDAQRLQQVMANFISNAVKFSPTEGNVEICLKLRDQRVEVAVIDHGPGVSEEFRARIFQKFAQADSSDSRQRGGTGLGLSISKAFVERMHGVIGFESEPGHGATFFAIFPVAEITEENTADILSTH
ncbi:MAG: PAS domain-containing protein [Cellvibrio sp.]|uniref:PAS domain-containing protein n=1 Tax=Cellvibrio sp. TaxID=1965322 RepID=UPI0031B2C851